MSIEHYFTGNKVYCKIFFLFSIAVMSTGFVNFTGAILLYDSYFSISYKQV